MLMQPWFKARNSAPALCWLLALPMMLALLSLSSSKRRIRARWGSKNVLRNSKATAVKLYEVVARISTFEMSSDDKTLK